MCEALSEWLPGVFLMIFALDYLDTKRIAARALRDLSDLRASIAAEAKAGAGPCSDE